MYLSQNCKGTLTNLQQVFKVTSANENWSPVTLAIARIIAAKPHSCDVERLVSAYNQLKDTDRCKMSAETMDTYLNIRINMPPLAEAYRPVKCRNNHGYCMSCLGTWYLMNERGYTNKKGVSVDRRIQAKMFQRDSDERQTMPRMHHHGQERGYTTKMMSRLTEEARKWCFEEMLMSDKRCPACTVVGKFRRISMPTQTATPTATVPTVWTSIQYLHNYIAIGKSYIIPIAYVGVPCYVCLTARL